VPTLLLLRHGRSTANTAGVLAGRADGVELDETGRAQADDAASRLASLPLAAVVTSPLTRCVQTAEHVLARQPEPRPGLVVDDALTECDYGAWQGRPLAELAQEPLWRTVQQRPSEVTFPGGESMVAMAARAVEAVRRHDAEVARRHGPDAVWLAVSHGDVVKALLADALGMALDDFQRLDVHPASVSVVVRGGERPLVLGVNTLAGDLGWLRRAPSDATVGGATGREADASTA